MNPKPLKRALLVVDMQNDFMPQGALGVPHADEIVAPVNRLMRSKRFSRLIASRDAHPADHCSFEKFGGSWPEHCVRDTHGFQIVDALNGFDLIVDKGIYKSADSYSAFYQAQDKPTELAAYLKSHDISEVWIAGVALEYCVKETALDCKKAGFETVLYKDGVKALGTPMETYRELERAGVKIL